MPDFKSKYPEENGLNVTAKKETPDEHPIEGVAVRGQEIRLEKIVKTAEEENAQKLNEMMEEYRDELNSRLKSLKWD